MRQAFMLDSSCLFSSSTEVERKLMEVAVVLFKFLDHALSLTFERFS